MAITKTIDQVEPLKYKQLIRSVGVVDVPEKGIFSAQSVDKTLSEWYEQGYELFSVDINYVKKEPEMPEHWYCFYVLKLKE